MYAVLNTHVDEQEALLEYVCGLDSNLIHQTNKVIYCMRVLVPRLL